tara:strand:+ start:6923 stop:9034 length:2112 start_codon:yes stop_codon:yes gene_type:complete
MAAPGKNLVSEKEIFDYLMTKPGMDRIKAAGILANIAKESLYYSDAVEQGGEGIGLFQYTFKARKDAFLAAVPDWETNWRAQIDFAFDEGEFESYMKQDYNSVTDSTRGFMKIFEKPQDQSEDEVQDRVDRLYNSPGVQEDIKELKVKMSAEESSISVDKSKTKEQIEYEKLEGYREGQGIALRVYDNKTNRNIQVNAQWDVNSQSWSFNSPNRPEDMTDEELNKLGNYLVDPKMMWHKEGDAFYGTFSQDGYEPYTTENGIETQRFIVYDNPISNRLSRKQKEKISQKQVEKTEEDIKKLKNRKSSEELARDFTINDLQKKIKEAKKAKTLGPSAYNKYLEKGGIPIEKLEETYNNKLLQFQKEQKNEDLADAVALEKDLRRRKAEMENDPERFSEQQINKINQALDQVAFEIYDLTGNQDNTGPNGYTREEVEGREYDFSDPVVVTEIEPEDTVPEEAKVETPTELNEVIVDEDTPVSEDPTTETKQRSTLGDLAGLVDGLGGVSSIIAGVMGARGFKESMKKIDVREYPELSSAFKEHLYQAQELAKIGFTPEEERAIRDDIDTAYRTGIENMVRGTAGDRAKFLASSGVLDANRSNALLKFAAEDAEVKRQNKANHTALLQYVEEYNTNKDIALRQEEMAMQLENKKAAGEFASSAFKYVMDGVQNARAMKGPYGKYLEYMQNRMTGTNTTVPLDSNID